MFYPMVPLERSLDGQMFYPMPPLDVRYLFQEFENLGATLSELRYLCEQLEGGETVDMTPVFEKLSLDDCAVWLRMSIPKELASMDRLRSMLAGGPTE